MGTDQQATLQPLLYVKLQKWVKKYHRCLLKILESGTYVDGIIDSFGSPERAENVKADIERIIQPGRGWGGGGVKIKKWLTSWKDSILE